MAAGIRNEAIRRSRWTRALVLVAGLFVLFLAYRVLFVYTLRSRPCPTPSSDLQSIGGPPSQLLRPAPSTVKVLSYNIEGHAALFHQRHLEKVARLIVDQNPDIVALQEVHRGTWQARFVDQPAELARRTGLAAHFGPSFRALGGEFGNLLLTRGRILSARQSPLPGLGEPRSLLQATVEVDGATLEVFVTHLAAWGRLNRRVRSAQLRCLADSLRASPRPFVLCGDLNAVPGSAGLELLEATDFAQLCGLASEPTHALLGQRLDYVFADLRWRVVEARVLHSGPSDHWPIVVSLAWPGDGHPG